jgi:hypothetical protein
LGSILYSLQLDKSTTNNKDYLLSQAFQEHGLTSFNLQILVHCCPEELAEKEQYYLNLYQSEYNVREDDFITTPETNTETMPIEPISTLNDSFLVEENDEAYYCDDALVTDEIPDESLIDELYTEPETNEPITNPIADSNTLAQSEAEQNTEPIRTVVCPIEDEEIFSAASKPKKS